MSEIDNAGLNSLAAHVRSTAINAQSLVTHLRADLYLMAALLRLPEMQSGPYAPSINTQAIVDELDAAKAIVLGIHDASRARSDIIDRYRGRRCPLNCGAAVIDAERGRGSQVILICENGHRALIDGQGAEPESND